MQNFESRLQEMARSPRAVVAAVAVVAAFGLAMWASAVAAAIAVVPLALVAAFATASGESAGTEREALRAGIDAGLKRRGNRLSILDPQTALLKPWYFELRLADEARRCRRYGLRMAALFIRIEEEEVLGGDPDWKTEVEMDLVQILARNLRAVDLASRTGEREFAVCLPHTSEDGAHSAACRIAENVGSYSITARLAMIPEDGIDYEGLYAKAEAFTPSEPAAGLQKPEQARLVELLQASPFGEISLEHGQSAGIAKSKLRRASKQAGIDIRVWEQDGAVRFERLSSGSHRGSGAA